MTEQLWEMYKTEATKANELRKIQDKDRNGYTMIEQITQDGITQGILRCLEKLEGKRAWKKGFEINCEINGIDLETGFGTWETVKKPPKKDGWYLVTLDGEIAGEENDFVGMCSFENGKWDEEDCVIAWMPLPIPAKRDE